MSNISFVFTVLWTSIISCSVSLTWSSSINSMFTARTLIPRTTGVDTDIIESIAAGGQMAMNTCKNVFKWDKWNCPESTFSKGLKHPANREQAFAHAIISAGIVHSITKNCSRGQLKGCGCSPYLRGPASLKQQQHLFENDIKSYSCSDDVEFGQLMAKIVLDEVERGNDNQAYVNLHNNFVGRQIVQSTMIKKCKCHGVSGSCSLQTCWMQVAPFTKIANMLQQRYKRAIKIDLENTSNKILHGNSSPASTIVERHPYISPKRLVFLEYSPDYCMANSTTGWTGTKGRMCSRSRLEKTSLAEKRSCKTICRSCGHRVRKHKKQIEVMCKCSFKWCCEVQCDTCTKTVEEYFCE
ncbi:hypothetical protein ILUMI_05678 [Ignelater luminosus]|uniref:Protein Wnt n=1 Tax=Ignelater luminosus TaxID=2038154 RepID=A0A8K0GJV8_IGNLU|nr:hypothetical protein ILUMI_05678 [Ignelater luminosus]